MYLLREIRLMKYLVVALTLIFSMSGSVNADDPHTRWVLIMAALLDYGDGTFLQQTTQQSDGWKIQTYRDESDCHQGLKSLALEKNKTVDGFKGESAFKIEVVDDFRFKAKSTTNKIMFTQIHCVQITLQ